MSLDKHTLKTETWTYDPWAKERARAAIQQQQQRQQEGDSFWIQKNVNGWVVLLSVNEEGKVSMIATKTIGKLAGSASASDNQAQIKVILETTEKRSPLVKVVGYDTYNPKHVEINDEQNRVTESFKKENETYESQYPQSSVLETIEYFTEICPEFSQLLQEKKLDEYIPRIAESASKVVKPFNRNYRLVK